MKASRGQQEWRAAFARDLPVVKDCNPVSMTLGGLKRGRYRISFRQDGASGAHWFERYPKSNIVAIFTGFERVRTNEEGFAKMARRWAGEILKAASG